MIVNRGEIREIGIQVHSKIGQPFVIDAAEYSVLTSSGEPIEKGIATIEGSKVLAFFDAKDKGDYTFKFKYMIGCETLIAKVQIGVI